MNSMKYKGYIARVAFDDEDRLFVGHLAGIRDIVGFHGTTVDELEAAYHETVDRYISISEETGRPAQKKSRISPWFSLSTIGVLAYSHFMPDSWTRLMAALLLIPIATLFVWVSGLILNEAGLILSILFSLVVMVGVLFS